MPIPGLDADKCARRNYTAAKRDGVNAVPVRFLRGDELTNLFVESPGNRGGVGKLPKSDNEALSMINAVAPRALAGNPYTADDLYIHYMEAASDAFIADRSMFMDDSTLRNIATDAGAGFAFMNSHRTGGLSHPAELPFGRAFAGRFEKVVVDDSEGADESDVPATRTRTVVGIYMLKGQYPNGANGPSTDTLHDGIDSGTIFDVSVGLWNGQALCDICGNDVDDWYECDHIPGTHYGMDDEDVAMQEDRGIPGGVASYTLYDARCGEVSAVYDGAVPGAGFTKALRFAQDADSERESVTLAEIAVAYPKLLQGGASSHSTLAETILSFLTQGGSPITPKGNNSMSGQNGQATAPRPSTRRLPFGLGRAEQEADTITAEPFVQLSPEQYNDLVKGKETAERERDEARSNPVLAAATAEGIKTADDFAKLAARAKDGDKFAESVGAELSKQAVRRFGPEASKAKVDVYSKFSISEQQLAAKEWKQEADEKFGIKGEDEDGTDKGSERKTMPKVASNAENLGGSGSGKAWDRLTDEQKAVGTQMGMNTDEKREAFAKNTLAVGGN